MEVAWGRGAWKWILSSCCRLHCISNIIIKLFYCNFVIMCLNFSWNFPWKQVFFQNQFHNDSSWKYFNFKYFWIHWQFFIDFFCFYILLFVVFRDKQNFWKICIVNEFFSRLTRRIFKKFFRKFSKKIILYLSDTFENKFSWKLKRNSSSVRTYHII